MDNELSWNQQFDFWLGEWDLTWGDDEHGINRIERIMEGAAIQENFEGGDPPLKGISLSVFSREDSRWHQTWVDNSGSYLDFVGEFRDGKMTLMRDGVVHGKPVKQRMIWFGISQNGFEWNWERSDDEGENWTVLWNIHYQRR
jgi:hypothetical protein